MYFHRLITKNTVQKSKITAKNIFWLDFISEFLEIKRNSYEKFGIPQKSIFSSGTV